MDIYQNAYVTLTKIAEEQGIDVEELSDDEVAELIEELVEEQAEREEGGDGTKEAQLTYADVAHELAKIAHAEGVDPAELSSTEYARIFDKLASEMSSPYYWQEQEKIAEADFVGRIMARSFNDELMKLADDSKAYQEWLRSAGKDQKARERAERAAQNRKGSTRDANQMIRDAKETSPTHATSKSTKKTLEARKELARQRVGRDAAYSTRADLAVRRLGKRVASGLGADGGSKWLTTATGQRRAGYGALGAGALGLGAAAAGTKKLLEKNSFDLTFEADAQNLALHMLGEPAEFSKMASYGDPDYNYAVELRAEEILAEAGLL